jgi:predicted nucleotidyltransferase
VSVVAAAGAEAQIVAEVHRAVGRRPVLLGGSRATGAAGSESDYDVVVVMPAVAVPWGMPKLGRVARRLERQLDVGVSVNPVPAFHLRPRPSKLFAWKLRREGRVLAAPGGFELTRPGPFALTDATRFSYAMSAAMYLLESVGPGDLDGPPAPPAAIRAAEKALLHVAQLRLLARGDYASGLEAALDVLEDGRLRRLAGALTGSGGVLSVRDLVLEELGRPSGRVAGPRAVVGNAQYLALSAARGRSRVRAAVRPGSVERCLAGATVLLLRALPEGASASPDVVEAHRMLGRFADARGARSWSALRDLVVDEWSNAHPLLGL